MKKTEALPHRHVIIKRDSRKNRWAVASSFIVMAVALSACESSQLPGLGGFLSSDNKKTAAVQKEETGSKAQALQTESVPQVETAKINAGTEESIVLDGPATTTATNSGAYPSLSEQPAKPVGILKKHEKDREIRELQNAGKNPCERPGT